MRNATSVCWLLAAVAVIAVGCANRDSGAPL